MKILVTGGAGYIGSILVNKLIDLGHQVNVIDDLTNGFEENIDKGANFIKGSILDESKLDLALEGIEVVYHLAAKTKVEESEKQPELYKKVNIEGTLNLIKKCSEKNIKKLVFASTAAVYGNPENFPVNENSNVNPISVYGATKLEIDNHLEKNAETLGISAICFRFFNIGGALQTKKGGWLKIRHEGATHLIPSILHSSTEKPLLIFGNDWSTKDGTPIRDFVHVVDLVDALIKSLKKLEISGNQIINLGTSTGSTVLDVVKTAEVALQRSIPYQFTDRRAGDSFASVTSNEKAKQFLGWTPTKSLSEILQDAQAELIANN
jgi:UDP-glucose 4-epimerase